MESAGCLRGEGSEAVPRSDTDTMSEELSQRDALLVLNGLRRIGPIVLRRLMEAFGHDAPAILSAGRARLTAVEGVGGKVAEAIHGWREQFDLGREKATMEKSGTRFLVESDPGYPAMLREIHDPPIGLYWKGDYEVDRPCIALVGTRRTTLYGRSMAKRFAAELSRLGFCVVSGMARGTDSAAHEGALEAGGKTLAVFGCGMDIIYPPENLDLYKELVAHGAVASEFPYGRRADRQTFPMRNRVVSGMCEAVLVVESDVNGGSMITARFAGEQGRTVMAMPGRIDQASSRGCHRLIRDGAVLVGSVDDVFEELRYARPDAPELPLEDGAPERARADLSEVEAKVMAQLEGGAVVSPDSVASAAGVSISEVNGVLMGLELKRLVAKRADGCFEAC